MRYFVTVLNINSYSYTKNVFRYPKGSHFPILYFDRKLLANKTLLCSLNTVGTTTLLKAREIRPLTSLVITHLLNCTVMNNWRSTPPTEEVWGILLGHYYSTLLFSISKQYDCAFAWLQRLWNFTLKLSSSGVCKLSFLSFSEFHVFMKHNIILVKSRSAGAIGSIHQYEPVPPAAKARGYVEHVVCHLARWVQYIHVLHWLHHSLTTVVNERHKLGWNITCHRPSYDVSLRTIYCKLPWPRDNWKTH